MVFFLTFSFNVAMCQEGNREAVLKDLSFDKKTGTISYELTVPARVRIRIGIVEGPLYRTIVDWQERGTGKHKEEWNGMDALGTFKLAGREDLVFTFNYFTAGGEYLRNIQVMDILPLAGNLTGRNLPNLEVNRMHKKHYRQFCHEPKIEIRLPKNIRRNKDNFYIVKEKIPIEISLVGEDKSWFRAERYSLHIFVDDVFAQGELDGYSPYTWIFDPKGLNEGKHLIVVNLAGFNDHYGIASLPVYIHSSKNTKTVNKAGRISYGTKNKKL
jgi:hypothetical protein